jgi:DUF971 family protein
VDAANTPIEVIQRRDPSRLELVWGDGHRSDYPALELRLRCPCAECLSGGERHVRPAPAPDVTLDAVEPFGNYALALRFSDGHGSGVYRWEYLRYWCPCDPCWTRREREMGREQPDDAMASHSHGSCSASSAPSSPPSAAQPQPLVFKRP